MKLKIERQGDDVKLIDSDGSEHEPSEHGLTGLILEKGQPAVKDERGVMFLGYVEVAE
jgi:hypothetical protein